MKSEMVLILWERIRRYAGLLTRCGAHRETFIETRAGYGQSVFAHLESQIRQFGIAGKRLVCPFMA